MTAAGDAERRRAVDRRTWLLGGGAAVAAIAGVVVALRRPVEPPPETSPADLWSLTFATPDGAPFTLAPFRGRPLVVNFWATWCVPCITELPLLDAFHRRQAAARGWQVVALALDTAPNVRRFLAERTLTLPVAIAGAEALDLPRRLGNDRGGLPFSVVYDAAGRPAATHLGALDDERLQAWVASLN